MIECPNVNAVQLVTRLPIGPYHHNQFMESCRLNKEITKKKFVVAFANPHLALTAGTYNDGKWWPFFQNHWKVDDFVFFRLVFWLVEQKIQPWRKVVWYDDTCTLLKYSTSWSRVFYFCLSTLLTFINRQAKHGGSLNMVSNWKQNASMVDGL